MGHVTVETKIMLGDTKVVKASILQVPHGPARLFGKAEMRSYCAYELVILLVLAILLTV